MEQPELKLGDGAETIFVCTRGSADDIPEEVRQLLDYIESGRTKDGLTEELDSAVTQARYNPRWRTEYDDLQRIIEREKNELREDLAKERARAEKLEEEIRQLKAQLKQ